MWSVMLKVVDTECELKEADKELSCLRRHLSSMEDDHRVKERNFRATLEEAAQTEYQLSDDRRRLEQSLDEAGTQLIETRLQLSVSEGRVSALECQLAQVDSCRVETDTKLASVVSSLRRFVGLGGGRVLRSRSGSPLRSRTRSPRRSLSPVKGRCLIVE